MFRKTVLGTIVVVMLLASGCSSDGTAGDQASTDTGGSQGRGVTADTINIAAVYADFAKLEPVGVKINRGDQALAWKSVVKYYNDNGGVLGRSLNVSPVEYDILQATSGEAACTKVTQDQENFFVLGNFFGPADTANLCVAQAGVGNMGGSPTTEVATTTPWVNLQASDARRMGLFADLMVKTNTLQGKTFAVIGTARQKEAIETQLLATLSEAGLVPTDTFYSDAPDGDVQALKAQYDVYAEKIKTAGADFVILAGDAASGYSYLRDRGFDGQIASDNYNVVAAAGGLKELSPEAYNGYLTMAGPSPDEIWNDPSTQGCVKAFEEQNPDIGTLTGPYQVPEGEPDWGGAVADACTQLNLFKTMLETAGAPNNAAVVKAVTTQMSSFSVSAYLYCSFGPEKFDANDAFSLAEFDSTIGVSGALKPLGPLQDLGAG